MEKQMHITSTGVNIIPYYNHQNPYFEKITSTYDRATHKRNPVTGFLLEDATGDRFVTYLHNPGFLQENFPEYQIQYHKSFPGQLLSQPIHFNPDVEPREVQSELIDQVIHDEKNRQWFIYLSQGLGKTLLSVYLITYFGVKTLIMCRLTKILDQWYHTMCSKTDINPKKVLLIDKGTIFRKILDGTFPVWEYDIFMCTPGILTSFGKKHGYDTLQCLIVEMGIGFKIFDEAHLNIGNMIKINALTNVDRTLYLSGDFGQSSDKKQELYYRMFHGIPVLNPSKERMNTLKFTVAIVIRYDSHPSDLDKMGVYTRRGFSFYDYMKYQIRQEIFFDVLHYIINMIRSVNEKGYKILVLVNMIEHVDMVYDRLSKDYPDFITSRYHTKTSEEDRQICLTDANLIISTYQSFSVGVDVELIKYVISGSICTKIDDNQASGRARPLPDGSDAFYFMMADFGFQYTKKTLHKRLSYLHQTKIKDIQTVEYVE